MDSTREELMARIAQDKAQARASLHALGAKTDPLALLARGAKALRGGIQQTDSSPGSGRNSSLMGMAAQALGSAGLAAVERFLPGAPTPVEPPSPSVLAGTRVESVARWEDEGGPPAPEPASDEPGWLRDALHAHARARDLHAQINAAQQARTLPRSALKRERAAVDSALAHDIDAILARGLGEEDEARTATVTARAQLVHNALVEMGHAQPARPPQTPWLAGAAALAAGTAAAWWVRPSGTERRLVDVALGALLRAAGDVALDRFQRVASPPKRG